MRTQTLKKRELFAHALRAFGLGVFAVFGIGLILFNHTPVAYATATNSTINFQARLQTSAGAIAPDGNYNVEFKIYNVSSGGSALWTEDYLYNGNSPDQRLRVVNGYLSANLGSLTAFSGINWDQDTYLTMNIGGAGTSSSWDGEMNPRLKVTSVPYALRAGQLAQYNATTGYTSTLGIAQPTGGNQTFQIQDQGAAGTYNLLTQNTGDGRYLQLQATTPGIAQTGNFNITGTGIAGTLQAPTIQSASGAALGITAGAALTLQSTTSSSVTLDSGTTGAVNVGTGANAKTIQIGTTSTNTGNTQTIGIGNLNAAGTTNVTIGTGSSATGGTTTVQGKTSILLGNATTPTITIETGASGTINIGDNAVANTIQLGATSGTASQTVNVGNNATASSTTTLTAGSLVGSSTTTIQGGTGSGAVSIQSGASGTISLGTVAQANTVNIGTTATNTGNTQTINIGTSAAAGTQNVNIGTASGATAGTTTIQGKTQLILQSATNVTVGNAATPTISIVASDTGSINLGATGSSAVGNTLHIADTTGAAQTIQIGGTGVTSGSHASTTVAIQGGQSALKVANTGVTAQTFTNTATAFQVQSASGDPAFMVNTVNTNGTLGLTNSNFETNTTGWTAKTGCTLSQDTTTSVFGNASAKCTDTATVDAGLKFNLTLAASTTYTFSFYLKGTNGAGTLTYGYAANGSNETTLTTQGDYIGSTWNRYYVTFTTGAVSGSPYLFIKQTDAVARSLWIDAVQIEAASGASAYNGGGSVSLNAVTSPLIVQPREAGVALRVMNTNTGNSSLLVADTNSYTLGVGISGSANNLFQVGTATTADYTALASFNTGVNSQVVLALQGASGQAANLLSLESSAGTVTGGFNSAGNLYYANSTFTSVVAAATLTRNQTISIPGITSGSTDTFCLLTLNNCSTSLQTAYNNSATTNPQIQLSATNGGLKVRDASSTVGNIIQVQNNAGSTTYFSVTANGAQAAAFDAQPSGSVTLGATNATSVTIGASGTATTFSGNVSIASGKTLGIAGATTISATSSTALMVQDATSNVLLTVDTSALQVVVGTTSNGVVLTNSGIGLFGTAQKTKAIVLMPEFGGAVLDPGSGSNNNGTITSAYDSTNRMNYYKWTTTQGSNQSYDVDVQVPIPSDFSGWGTTPMSVTAYTSNTTNGTITVQVVKSNGSADSNFSSFQSATPGSTSTWTTTNFSTFNSSNYTAGDYLTVRIRLQSPNGGDVRLGKIVLNYKNAY